MSALAELPGFATMDEAEDAARIVAAGLDAEAAAWEISPNPQGGFQVCITWSRQRYDAPQVTWIGRGRPHVRFSIAPLATHQFAVIFTPAPRADFDAGTVASGMRFPVFVAAEGIERPAEQVARLAAILNQHWPHPAEGEQV